MQLIEITDDAGQVVAGDWLQRSEAVHRQLRPTLPADYVGTLQRVFAGGGRMVIATSGEAVQGVAVWRCYENTHAGRIVYVDDLVTDEQCRSTGVGAALIGWLTARSQALGATALTLDSGTHRRAAHRFYLRERFEITSFHFHKSLQS